MRSITNNDGKDTNVASTTIFFGHLNRHPFNRAPLRRQRNGKYWSGFPSIATKSPFPHLIQHPPRVPKGDFQSRHTPPCLNHEWEPISPTVLAAPASQDTGSRSPRRPPPLRPGSAHAHNAYHNVAESMPSPYTVNSFAWK